MVEGQYASRTRGRMTVKNAPLLTPTSNYLYVLSQRESALLHPSYLRFAVLGLFLILMSALLVGKSTSSGNLQALTVSAPVIIPYKRVTPSSHDHRTYALPILASTPHHHSRWFLRSSRSQEIIRSSKPGDESSLSTEVDASNYADSDEYPDSLGTRTTRDAKQTSSDSQVVPIATDSKVYATSDGDHTDNALPDDGQVREVSTRSKETIDTVDQDREKLERELGYAGEDD